MKITRVKTAFLIGLISLLLSGCDSRPRMIRAIMNHDAGAVKLLLEGGMDPNFRYGDTQMTPLLTAAYLGGPEVTRVLIDHGAEVNAREIQGDTALHMAAGAGDCSTIRVLVASGADVDEPGGWRSTPIMNAVMYGKRESVRCLIDLGANLNVQASRGSTVLMCAVGHGDPEIVQILLDAGADASIRAEDGGTAEDMAACLSNSTAKSQHTDEILRLLRGSQQVSKNKTTVKKGR